MLNQKWFKLLLILAVAVAAFFILSQFFSDVFSDMTAKIIGGVIALIGVFFDRFRKKSGH